MGVDVAGWRTVNSGYRGWNSSREVIAPVASTSKSCPKPEVRGFQQVPDEQIRLWLLLEKNSVPNKFETVAYLNFPGMLPALLIDRFTTWPNDWMPAWSDVLGMWGWRSISWSIFCLPFWWVAGRGLDAFLASLTDKKSQFICWFEAWGLAICGICICILGSGLAITANEDFPEMKWLFIPAAMWFVFGLISLLAWFRRRRAFGRQAEMPARTG
jgi:hypothetical protein